MLILPNLVESVQLLETSVNMQQHVDEVSASWSQCVVNSPFRTGMKVILGTTRITVIFLPLSGIMANN